MNPRRLRLTVSLVAAGFVAGATLASALWAGHAASQARTIAALQAAVAPDLSVEYGAPDVVCSTWLDRVQDEPSYGDYSSTSARTIALECVLGPALDPVGRRSYAWVLADGPLPPWGRP